MGNDRERHEVAHGGEVEGEEVDLANKHDANKRYTLVYPYRSVLVGALHTS